MATVFYANGSVSMIEPENGRDFKFQELKDAGIFDKDAYIEIVYIGSDIMLIDEEGKLKSLPYNKEATTMAHGADAIYQSDYIAGNAVVCHDSEVL